MLASPAGPAGEDASSCLGADPFRLAQANINPVTGLSTDYLNHFNEAVMLLELVPAMPECRLDFLAWRPLSYHEHFAASRLTQREFAIAAYELADPLTRSEFDALCEAINAAVVAARDSLHPDLAPDAAARIAAEAAAWLKPLVARASAVIHGLDVAAGGPACIQEPQSAIDAIIERHAP
jgi:hypothetical protein